ncbi:hypothetical protein [Clostridium botulinum]|uniref:hypothetical protein n=1 Tax=Clostridium botulinum TaxID=1491 RepID=UPI001E50E3EB|nr:hypothetical protein [Clostridium botulinum]
MGGCEWKHGIPKEMLKEIKRHSQILKQYNQQMKEYFKYNNDYMIEKRRLNDIFCK